MTNKKKRVFSTWEYPQTVSDLRHREDFRHREELSEERWTLQ